MQYSKTIAPKREVKIMRKHLKRTVSCFVAAALMATSIMAPLSPAGTPTAQAQIKTHVSVHDPSIAVSKEGTYYVFGSHIDAAKSTDLINWQTFTNGYTTPNNKLFGDMAKNLAEPFKWAGDHDVDAKNYSIWAPDVFWNPRYDNGDGTKGAYMMYFCTTSTAVRSVIAFATSQNIEGPYTYKKSLIYSGFTKESAKDGGSRVDKKYTNTNIGQLIANGTLKDGLNDNWFRGNTTYNNSYAPNAIDPTIFEDKDGKLWMTYGSWSGGIYILEVDPATGDVKYPGKNGTASGNRIVDQYFGTRISGGFAKSGEGPYILYDKDSDYYYLYVSYEWLGVDGGYNMRLFRSKNPDGPYTDAAGNNAALESMSTNYMNNGIKVMGNYNLPYIWYAYKAPGHNSAFIDEKTGKRFLIYHTRFQGRGEVHQLRVHQQFLNEQGWPVTAPYEYTGESISPTGYATDEVVGEYAFVNHGITSDRTTVNEAKNIVLKKNGTITGDVTGTWTAKAGTYHMSVKTGGVTYSGVFLKQTKETSDAHVMTFSAIGTNNQTVFGVKKSVGLSAPKSTIYTGGNKDKTVQLKLNGVAESTYTVSYKSSKPSVASVSKKGKVTAKKKGSAKITATVKIGNSTKTVSKTIKVKKAYLKFSKKKTSLKVKKSYKYRVKAYGIKASSVRFKSSKASVLKINKKTGKATAKKKGTAKITASYKKAKVTVKVKVK